MEYCDMFLCSYVSTYICMCTYVSTSCIYMYLSLQVRARISVAEKKHSVHKMGRERLGSLDRITKSPRTSSPAHSPFSHSPLSRSYSSSTEIKSDGELSTDGVGGCGHRLLSNCVLLALIWVSNANYCINRIRNTRKE